MPYIDKTPVPNIIESMRLYESVARDHNLDGYNALKCIKNLHQIQFALSKALDNVADMNIKGLDEWLLEQQGRNDV